MGMGPHHSRSCGNTIPLRGIRRTAVLSKNRLYPFTTARMGPLPHRRDGALRYVSRGMSDSTPQNPFSTLRQLARQATQSAEEQCDLCGEPIPPEHRHLLNVSSRELLCACRACALLFDRPEAGGGARKLIPTRYRYLPDFEMTDAQWESLRLPVNMAFFSYNTPAGRVVALYPSPMGPTESLLTLDTWEDLEKQNPILKGMEPDVEALLVNRVRDAREYFLVPIDECYKLVGLIRTYWKGFSGGREVWQQIELFFGGLKRHAGVSAPRGYAGDA
jgi:hypothetical protein